MIFVILGSQKFQFNRLLRKIDILIERDVIKEEVFAQIGYSDYQPSNYKYKDFIDREEFNSIMSKCNLVLTHGGTGTIIRAIRYEKKVIAIPRLKIYGEHVDDHQIQVTKKLQELNHILTIEDLDEFEEKYHNIYNINFEKFISNTQLIDSIRDYIDSVS